MRVSASLLALLLTASPALADFPDNPPKNPPVRHQMQKPKPKTVGHPLPAPSPDPSAGSGSYGAPAGAASNGGEQGY
jgi:hypothetical protein